MGCHVGKGGTRRRSLRAKCGIGRRRGPAAGKIDVERVGPESKPGKKLMGGGFAQHLVEAERTVSLPLPVRIPLQIGNRVAAQIDEDRLGAGGIDRVEADAT